MGRLLKWVFGLSLSLLALVLVAMLAVTILVDPNDYKPQIISQVKQHTGRELTIDGDIELSLFPWLGLELGAVSLGNAEGFGPEPFAAIDGVDAKVKILPLLRAEVEMDTIVLRGLELNLSRRADGSSNWDDLGAQGQPAADTTENQDAGGPSSGNGLAGLAIDGVEIREANVKWDDKLGGQKLVVRDFNLVSGAISLGQPFPLSLKGKVSTTQPALETGIDLTSRITLNLEQQRYRLEGTELKLDSRGEVIPGGKAAVSLGGNFVADLAQQTASASGLRLQGMGLSLTAEVTGRQIIDNPAFSGELGSEEFVPRDLLASAGVALPEMADPSAMTRAKLASRFEAGLDSVALNGLKLQLDDTTLSGEATVERFSAPIIRYQLAVDEIDADRYLPPPSQGQAEQPPVAQGGDEATTLPLELMRSLDIDGTLEVGKVKVMNLHSDSIITTVRAQEGLFRVHPLSANLYQGGYSGDLSFDVRQDTPVLGMDERLSGVEAGPLLKDFMGKDYVTGRANMAAKLTARGLEPMAVRKSLNGNGDFSFDNGQINGVNIGYLIRKGYALYKGQPAPEEELEQTDFTALGGSFQVKNGLVSTSDLTARSPLFQVAGRGEVDLVGEKVDMRLDTTVVSSLKGAAEQTIDELDGVTLPITVKGNLTEPKFGVDVASVLKAKAKARVEKEKAEVKAKAEKRIDEEKEKLEEKARDKLKDMLKF